MDPEEDRRRELVRDSFEEERCFMMCCSTKRDDANNVLRLGMNDRDRNAAKQPKCHEALLAVAKPIVFIRRGETTKHKFRFREIQIVSFQVGLALSVVPLELHVQSVYTRPDGRNAKRRRLTPQFSGRALRDPARRVCMMK